MFPGGVLLSGGLDSSLTPQLQQRLAEQGKKLHSFFYRDADARML
jgi:asparagine synthetase B (glutamine-hydrolysing)